jgi:predicted transcriptional regulator
MNWNSKTKQWTDLKSVTVIKMATIARKLKAKRMSVKNIAEVLDRSESRVKEYLKTK